MSRADQKQMHELEFFPVLVSVVPGFLERYQIDELIPYIKNQTLKRHSEFIGDAVSSHDPYSFDLSNISKDVASCKNICLNVQTAVNAYTDRFGMFRVELSNSWINIQKKHSMLNYHTHPGSVVSGALYVKVDDNSSKLNFLNPNPFIKFTAKNSGNQSKYMYEHAFFQPENGDLVLFPSWLSHGSGSEKNMSNERIVISFNTIHTTESY